MSQGSQQTSDQKMKIDLDKIRTDAFDVREEVDEDHVEQIAESLKDDGQWNPIIVRPGDDGQYELIAGHTRYRAATEIGWDQLEATVKDISDEEANELALKTNLKRKGMSKIEEGKVINDMLDKHGLTQKELADRIGKSRRWVNERVRVALELDPTVKGLVQEGELSYNMARIVTQVEEDRQLEFAQRLIDRSVTAAAEASREKQRFQNNTIYTIGYEGMDFADFAEKLNENDIDILVDIRGSAESNYKPEFNGEILNDRLEEAGIEYRHIPELGVHHLIRSPYKEGEIGHECFKNWYSWWVRSESGFDLEGLVEELNLEGKPALMCIEAHAEPVEGQDIYCHRHHLAEMIKEADRDGEPMFTDRVDV